jgi:hypothetical protein
LKHCVASGRSVAHLRHRVAVEVDDRRLLSPIPQRGPSRVVELLSSFLSLCSLSSLSRLVAKLSSSEAPASETKHGSSPALEPAERRAPEEQGEFAGDVAVARRYGNQ